MDIGNALKQLRKERGFKTQKSFSEASDIPLNTLYQIEQGRAFPKKETINKICEALEVPSTYLLLFALTDEDIPDQKKSLFNVLSNSLKELVISE